MTTASNLNRAVQTTLASKRLGTPVFVRYTLQSEDPANTILPRLAQMTAAVRDWLAQPLARIYAIGSIETGQVALTLEFRQGASALVSWSRNPPRGHGVDLLVLGNHGSLTHDAGSAHLWDEAVTFDGPAADAMLQRLLEKALQSAGPVAADGEGKP